MFVSKREGTGPMTTSQMIEIFKQVIAGNDNPPSPKKKAKQ